MMTTELDQGTSVAATLGKAIIKHLLSCPPVTLKDDIRLTHATGRTLPLSLNDAVWGHSSHADSALRRLLTPMWLGLLSALAAHRRSDPGLSYEEGVHRMTRQR